MAKRNIEKKAHYALNPNLQRGPHVANNTLEAFKNGRLDTLRRFIFDSSICCHVSQDLSFFDAELSDEEKRVLLNASKPFGHIFTSFDERTQKLTTHVVYGEEGDVRDKYIERQTAVLLALTYAALGLDMRRIIELDRNDTSVFGREVAAPWDAYNHPRFRSDHLPRRMGL